MKLNIMLYYTQLTVPQKIQMIEVEVVCGYITQSVKIC